MQSGQSSFNFDKIIQTFAWVVVIDGMISSVENQLRVEVNVLENSWSDTVV